VKRGMGALLVLLALAAVSSAFGYGPLIVNWEGEQRIALLLGEPRLVVTKPGIAFSFPITRQLRFDGRFHHLSAEAREIQTQDRERVVVDNYIVWRISEPLLFYKSFPTGRAEAETQIDQEVRGKVREVIGQRTLRDVLEGARVEMMEEITAKSAAAVARFGVQVGDVRINRTELPRGAEANVHARMRAERERLARRNRAEGDERARIIRAAADQQARVIVAEARRDAAQLRGEGDAGAARIYAEAYQSDPGFFELLRGLEAYQRTLGERTTLLLSPDHEFFRLFQSGGENAAQR